MGTMSSAPTSSDAGEWLTSKTPIAPPSSLDPKPRFLSYAALVTGVWSGLISLVVFAIARLFGVPMDVVLEGTTIHVFWFAVLLVPVAAAQIGAMASLLLRGISHAQRIVFWIGTVIAVVSIATLLSRQRWFPPRLFWRSCTQLRGVWSFRRLPGSLGTPNQMRVLIGRFCD